MQQPHHDRARWDSRTGAARRVVDSQSQYGDRSPHAANSQPPSRKAPWRNHVLIGLVVLIVLGAAAVVSKPFRHQIDLSVIRQVIPYTQLYFPKSVPAQLKVGQKSSFDFAIENDEGRTYNYTYTVTMKDAKSHVVLEKDVVAIGSGDRVTRLVTVTPKDHKSKYLVTITLVGLNQSIHFYATTS